MAAKKRGLGRGLDVLLGPRAKHGGSASQQLLEHFGDTVYRTVIPRNVRLAEAPSYGIPILYYDKQSKGARSYLALAGEVVRRRAIETSVEGV